LGRDYHSHSGLTVPSSPCVFPTVQIPLLQRVRSDKVCLFVSRLIEQSNYFPFPAAGTQPVDSENVSVEGNVETSYLLEQVRAGPELLYYFCSDSHRSRLFAVPSVSRTQKIRISRVKTCLRKYKHCRTSQNYQSYTHVICRRTNSCSRCFGYPYAQPAKSFSCCCGAYCWCEIQRSGDFC
jgi:hypothetical protein